MYLGRIVERAPTLELVENPQHSYTQSLINTIPRPDPHFERGRVEIQGNPGDPIDIGERCWFRDRCPERMDGCGKTPEFVEVDADHRTACHLNYDHEESVSGGDDAIGSRPTTADGNAD